MALIKCYECGKEFSSTSIRCIHCGAIGKSHWWFGYLTFGLVAFLLMNWWGLGLVLPGWAIGGLMGLVIVIYCCFRPWPHTPWISSLKTKKTAEKKTAKSWDEIKNEDKKAERETGWLIEKFRNEEGARVFVAIVFVIVIGIIIIALQR